MARNCFGPNIVTDQTCTDPAVVTAELLYRLLLGRSADQPGMRDHVDALRSGASVQEVARAFVGSEEFALLGGTLGLAARLGAAPPDSPAFHHNPFFHYNSNFDAQGVMRAHAVDGLKTHPFYHTNFLGVLIDPKFFPGMPQVKAGEVEPIPIPANWHADIAEWGAALRAVDLSGDTFTVMELGCGWGCWLNNTAVAARRTSRKPYLIGIEADRGHLGFAREAYRANGFSDSQVTLIHGVAAAKSGVALFPRQDTPGVHWGLEPIIDASLVKVASAKLSGVYENIPMISIADATAPHHRIDLLHIDIQGGEAELIRGSLPSLCEKVAYIVIGTHSREIEGQIFSSLRAAGWALEIERPAFLSLSNGVPNVVVDGVQGWRNLRLLPFSA